MLGTLERVSQHQVLLPLLYVAPALGFWFALHGKPVLHIRIHELANRYPLVTRSYVFKTLTTRIFSSQGIPQKLLDANSVHFLKPGGNFKKVAAELLAAMG